MNSSKIGSLVDGTVTHVQEFGIYLASEIGMVLVLIPDLGLARHERIHDVFHIGQTLSVRIVLYNAEAQVYRATLVVDQR